MRASAALGLALLALLAGAGPAHALEASVHAWEWRVFDGRAQVVDRLVVQGPGAELRLHLPDRAQDLQVFVDRAAAPWSWVGPRTLEVRLARLATEPSAEVEVDVRYVAPVGPAGVAVERQVTVPAREGSVTLDLPEGWSATVDGVPFAGGALGALVPGQLLALRLAPASGPSPVLVLGGLTALVLLLTLARAARARARPLPEAMGLLDHLRELSVRLRTIVLVVAVLMVFLFTFALHPVEVGGTTLAVPVPSLGDNIAAQTFRLLAQQFLPPGVELVVVDPVSGALVQVEVALFLALLVAVPLVAYEAGSFLMPALLPQERRLLLRAVPAVTLLFVAGALFAYLLMVPTMMRVLYAYAEGLGARPLLAVDSLVGFAMVVTLVFGLAFELPVGMVALAKLGVATPRAMAAKWRHVVLGLFVVAAVITPDPSVISQLMVALPLLGLYLVGLVAARAVTPSQEAAAGAGSAA